MKKILILVLTSSVFIACQSGDKKANTSVTKDSLTKDSLSKTAKDSAIADVANYTTIEWLDSTYIDLGKQTEGKSIEITFRFKNTGNKNLVIQNVTASCGCTIPEKPEKPFAPGEEGVIKAAFNGAGQGEIRKDVHVTANTTPASSHTLTFRAEMIK